MPTVHAPCTIAVADPVAALARLASSGLFADYVVYERPGEWVFAADPIGELTVASTGSADYEVVEAGGDEVTRRHRSGRAVEVLAQALGEVRAQTGTSGERAYGWVGFEFCAGAFAARRYVVPGTVLAHVMIPGCEVRIDRDGASLRGMSARRADTVTRLLTGDVDRPTASEGVDVAVDADGYRQRVAAAIAEIRVGRYRKVIVSRRVEVPFDVDLPATYRLGRAHNTPARSFLLRMRGLQAAGFSPELVVSVDDSGVVTTEPLAGTRAFGVDAEADRLARVELETDPKEIAEHAVSVQVSVQEIGAVCVSAVMSDFMSVRERGSVQHLASTVSGRLAPGRTSWDALEALFPSVTASGVPKQAAVDAIFRHDAIPRGLYSGAVIMVDPTDALEATLVLRAVYSSQGRTWLRAGAGIVGQSDPEREFTETCEKLGSIAPYLVPAR